MFNLKLTSNSIIFLTSTLIVLILAHGMLTVAQDEPELELTKVIQGDLTQVESGDFFKYIIRYRCVGIENNCNNVVVTDPLPPELAGDAASVSVTGTIHTTSEVYDPATRTITWDFINPLPAGATGELVLQVRFPPGETPDNTVATNTARISSSNQTNEPSNSVNITAQSENKLFPRKRISGGVVDEETTYLLELCRPDDLSGQLNMSNITFTDNLPAGVIFVDADNGGSYNAGANTITWSIPAFDFTQQTCITRRAIVIFPSGTFNTGDTITNNLSITGTPTGQTPIVLTTDLQHGLEPPSASGSFDKRTFRDEISIGETFRFEFSARNDGNIALDDYVIRDVIPAQVDVTSIFTGDPITAAVPVAICYETNLDASCRAMPGSPYSDPAARTAASFLAPGEYITALEWDFGAGGTFPPGYGDPSTTNGLPGYDSVVLAVDRNGTPVLEGDIISNMGELEYTSGGNTTTDTDTESVEVVAPGARPQVIKAIDGDNSVNPGSILSYTLEIGNTSDALVPLTNPVFSDLLDSDVTFNTWSFSPGTTAPPAPSPLFEQIDNYNGTGQTLLRWRWEGAAAYSFQPGQSAMIRFSVEINSGTTAGTNNISNRAYLTDWDASVPRVSCPRTTDTNDLDNDGATNDDICSFNIVEASVNSQAVMESVKFVRGDLDTVWSRFPDTGNVSPGGFFDYRLQLDNIGNVPTTDIVLIDILPYIGDRGVIDTEPRDSAWKPVLETAITPPPGVTVEYSLTNNPCRPDFTVIAGCIAPNWTTAAPADLSTVGSLRFSLNAIVLNPGDTFNIEWRMRAPITAPPGEVTWNSFAFLATRTDTNTRLLAAEPFKVGVRTIALQPLAEKVVIPGQTGIFGWRITLINNQNDVPITTRIIDPIIIGTTYEPGSLQCTVVGISTTTRCEYDAPNDRIVWTGRIGEDRGATDAISAQNEVVITFNIIVPGGMATLSNQAQGQTDADNDGDFNDSSVDRAFTTNTVTLRLTPDSPGSSASGTSPDDTVSAAGENCPCPPGTTSGYDGVLTEEELLNRVSVLPSTGESPYSKWRGLIIAGGAIILIMLSGFISQRTLRLFRP